MPMESSATPPATQPTAHPVNVSVNPLQLLWLQESGIDRLWGRPLVASHGDASAAGPGHAAASHSAVNGVAAAGASATGPAAAGVTAVTPEAPSTGAAKEPPVPPPASTTTDPSPAKQALAKLRQQMERQRGKSAGRTGMSGRLSQVESGERTSEIVSGPSSGTPSPDHGEQAESATLREISAVEGLVYEKVSDAEADIKQTRQDGSEWPVLSKTIQQCTKCGLSEHARQPVPGTGPADAALMIIDQAPGAQDDASGEPLSGQAGILLDNMLKTIGLARQSVFITDVVKCRPMVGRSPQPQEIDACADYLQQQIALVQPRCVLLLGNAAQSVLGTTRPVGELRDAAELHISVQGRTIPVVVTFHPNHLMANQAAKPLAWLDLKRLRKILELAQA